MREMTLAFFSSVFQIGNLGPSLFATRAVRVNELLRQSGKNSAIQPRVPRLGS